MSAPLRRGLSAGAVGAALVVVLATCAASAPAHADDTASLFGAGVRALHEGRPGDAIGAFEALADRGVVDAAASYDRGLAYAQRVRIGAEVPGDLGRAAHGFEEARELTRDPRLAVDAARALAAVRSEVVRRRVRAGEPVEVDPGRSLARTVAGLLAESTWNVLAALASMALGAGLFVRWLARPRRARVSGALAAGVAAPVLVVATAMTIAARHDRLAVREAVIVSADARPTDEQGLTVAGATPLPEGARVEIVESRGSLTRVRFGSKRAWVSSNAVRELAHRS